MAPQSALLVRRLNASIMCLIPNIVPPTPRSRYPPFPVTPNWSWTVCFAPEKVEVSGNSWLWLCIWTSSHVHQLCPTNQFCCPCTSSFTLSFALGLGHLPSAWKSANITALHKKVQNLILLNADILAYFESPARSHSWCEILPFLRWSNFRSPIQI